MVAFRSLFTAIVGTILFSQSVQGSSLFESSAHQDRSLEVRQLPPVVEFDGCVTADIGVGVFVLLEDVCICAIGGALTPETVVQLTQTISASGGILRSLVNFLGGVTTVTTQVLANALPIVLQTPNLCDFPANSIPNECGGCGFECAEGFNRCGDQCIPVAQACVSGIPQRRRSLPARELSSKCPIGYSACMVSSYTKGSPINKNAFECIQTTVDLESCGGCAFPFPGQVAGQDCSAIANALSTTCQAGKCVVDSCEAGFTAKGSTCVSDASVGKKISSYWGAVQDTARIVLQE